MSNENDPKSSVRGGPRPPSASAPKASGAVHSPNAPPIYNPPPDFVAREGDVLVVSYPEVTIPLRQYASAKIGGLIYTRRLIEGESVADQFERVYAFLSARAEADAREKVKRYAMELRPMPEGQRTPSGSND